MNDRFWIAVWGEGGKAALPCEFCERVDTITGLGNEKLRAKVIRAHGWRRVDKKNCCPDCAVKFGIGWVNKLRRTLRKLRGVDKREKKV